MKNIIYLFIAIIIGVVGFMIGRSGGDQPQEDVVKVGLAHIASHPLFDEMVAGIKEGFANAGYTEGENIEFDLQNAGGQADLNQAIAQRFAGGDYGVIIPLSVPSSQAVVNFVKEIPVVFGAVLDPISAGLVASLEAPGANVTGVSEVPPYDAQLALVKQLLPKATTIGVIYNAEDANAAAGFDMIKEHVGDHDLDLVTVTVKTAKEVKAAAESLVKKEVDVIYMIPDPTVFEAEADVIAVALKAKVPLIAIDESGVGKGALIAATTDYHLVGVRTAELALRILQGEDPAMIPVASVTEVRLFVNTETAEAIDLELPESILKNATVYPPVVEETKDEAIMESDSTEKMEEKAVQ